MSASNQPINIIGKVEKYQFFYKGKKYFLNAFVTDKNPTYTILGTDFINKYKDLLFERAKFKIKPTIKTIVSIRNTGKNLQVKKGELLKEFKGLFSNEVNQNSLCTLSKHEIETGNAKPTAELN